jgi:hypothetical protein
MSQGLRFVIEIVERVELVGNRTSLKDTTLGGGWRQTSRPAADVRKGRLNNVVVVNIFILHKQ